jgi:hypothetical protein
MSTNRHEVRRQDDSRHVVRAQAFVVGKIDSFGVQNSRASP